MSPQVRFAIRVAVVALVAGLSALRAYLPDLSASEALQAILAAIVAGSAYAGVGVATPLEPSVGRSGDA